METKLTLKLDRETIEKIKAYAKERNTSLSKLTENYFRSLTADTSPEDSAFSTLVKELSGIIRLDSSKDERELYTDHLMEKYR